MSSSWGGVEGSLKGTGSVDQSLLAQYNKLEEDSGSRVDDEIGWRQIKKDTPPKTAAEYEALVKDYASKGFDVKAIDMDGGKDFTNANIAIKPMGDTSTPTEKEAPELSQTAKKAVAYTKAYEDFTMSGGYVDQEMGDLKARDSFMNDYKLNLQKSMKGRVRGNATATTKSDVADSFLKEKNGK